jgi:hypothetical protein
MTVRTSTLTTLAAAAVMVAAIVTRPGTLDWATSGKNDVPVVAKAPEAGATPVLVELFTSEGCSSCPPADALLGRLGKTQPVAGAEIIALEEHVDYWDRLGWKDPFSSEAATDRQNDFGDAFGGAQIYTPQMIVDGRTQFVGSSNSDALRAIRAASQGHKPAVQLSWEKDDTLAIRVDALNADPLNPDTSKIATPRDSRQVFLVVAENMLHSDVRRGENAGRALEHNGVVRQLLPVGKIDAPSAPFSSTVAVHAARDWNHANLRAVVFVQERRSRHIVAAAAIPFPKA